MALLPARPLFVDPKASARLARSAGLSLLLFGVMGLGFGAGGVFLVRTLLDERAVWARGEPGEIVELGGKITERNKLGFTVSYEYALDVTYRDKSGQQHTGRAEFDYFWSGLPAETVHVLRYDPADPQRFVLAAQAEGGLPRWGFAILCAVMTVIFVVGVVFVARAEERRKRVLALVMEDGEEVVAELVSLNVVNGSYTVEFRFIDSTEKFRESLSVPPLVVAGVPERVVVLRSQRDLRLPMVVRSDLSPFLIDPATADDIRARAAAGQS